MGEWKGRGEKIGGWEGGRKGEGREEFKCSNLLVLPSFFVYMMHYSFSPPPLSIQSFQFGRGQ